MARKIGSDRSRLPSPNGGFTMLEMLVVVIIIGILAGMILFIIKAAGSANQRAVTHEHIQKLRAACQEFYAEYGQYPPVNVGGAQPLAYEYACYPGMNQNAYNLLIGGQNSNNVVFQFGLMSYLVPRYAGRASTLTNAPPAPSFPLCQNNWQWPSQNSTVGDMARDLNAMRRWSPFLEGICSTPSRPRPIPPGTIAYTNSCLTVYDGWGHELHYSSPPPYQKFDIWSDGPDGANGTQDDIHDAPGQ